MAATRVLMITVEGQSKHMVDRAANLLQDQVRTLSTFIQGTMEDAAGGTMDDPPPPVPTITVDNMPVHGIGGD